MVYNLLQHMQCDLNVPPPGASLVGFVRFNMVGFVRPITIDFAHKNKIKCHNMWLHYVIKEHGISPLHLH